MSETPWIKFYASDWLAGTGALTAAEKGVYITLLSLMYESSGPIAEDRPRLARRCGIPAGSFKRILDALINEGKIVRIDGTLFNLRAKQEIGERQNLRTKQQRGAQKTNAIRAKKIKQKQGEQGRSPSRSAVRKPEPESDIKEDTNVSSKKTRESNGTRLPSEWVPTREHIDFALSEGLDLKGAENEGEKFRDYWCSVPGAKGRKADWFATWRNWIRRSIETRGKTGRSGGRADTAQITRDLIDEERGFFDGWSDSQHSGSAGNVTPITYASNRRTDF